MRAFTDIDEIAFFEHRRFSFSSHSKDGNVLTHFRYAAAFRASILDSWRLVVVASFQVDARKRNIKKLLLRSCRHGLHDIYKQHALLAFSIRLARTASCRSGGACSPDAFYGRRYYYLNFSPGIRIVASNCRQRRPGLEGHFAGRALPAGCRCTTG